MLHHFFYFLYFDGQLRFYLIAEFLNFGFGRVPRRFCGPNAIVRNVQIFDCLLDKCLCASLSFGSVIIRVSDEFGCLVDKF